ncbi:hypothetical protein C8R44DRAFT_749708 [Mycena epipterygia]|nr:hypothetical protein C8R44DRAFT_749708 [Mycena epipterygia]
MKLAPLLIVFFPLISPTLAANSFAGSNNYFAWALPQSDRLALLDGMQAAGMKVLRTWVTGLGAGQKASDSIAVPDLEANGIGNYDDTVLNMIDQLMYMQAKNWLRWTRTPAGDSLLKSIDLRKVNALEGGDIYGSTYGTEGFYTSSAAINNFNQRITHILNGHKNALLGNQPWSDLSAYIFGLEPQNEPMIFDQSFYTVRN